MNEFKSASLAEQVFRKLETDIILGIYKRGELLTELKLVEHLGVSRTPIREALRRLEQERLIEDTGKGSRVLGITEEDLEDIMSIRVFTEAMAAYYAATNGSEADKKELNHIMDLQEFYFAKRDLEHLQQMDDAFHDLICRMGRRSVITDTLQPLHRKTRRYRMASMEMQERLPVMPREHDAIGQAILAGDGELAAERMRTHIENAKKNMMEKVKRNG